jgi:hypothetical protein
MCEKLTTKSTAHTFIHSAVCLMTGPQPLPKRVLHSVRSTVSSFNFQYPLISLRSSSSCLCLLPRLPITSILPPIFPSVTGFRRQFVRKIRPIQLVFLLFTVCRTKKTGKRESYTITLQVIYCTRNY